MFINVFTETGLYQRSRTGINYPYIFPETRRSTTRSRRSPVQRRSTSSTAAPTRRRRPGRSTPSATSRRWSRGRHTFKAGVLVEYSGEDDFDQINVSADPGQHQQPERPLRVPRRPRRRHRPRPSPTPPWACSATTPSSASATSPSGARWRPTCSSRIRGSRPANLTVEGGFRYVYWPPWYSTTNNIANFDPRLLRPGQRGGDRSDARAGSSSGARYNGIVLPGRRLRGRGQRPRRRRRTRRCRRCSAASRAASRRRTATSSSRASASATRSNEQDGAPRQRRHLPQPRHAERLDAARRQPAVPAAGDGRPTAASTTRAAPAATRGDLPFGINGAGPGVQAPDVVHVVGRRAARDAVRLHRRRHLRRAPRPLPAARAQHQPAASRARIQANPGVNIAALRPYTGYGVIRLSENAGRSIYHSLQISADRRYTQRPEGRRRLHARQVDATTAATSATCCSTPTTTRSTGAARSSTAGTRGQRPLHLRPAVLARPGHADEEPARRLADLGRDVHAHAARRSRSCRRPATSPASATPASASRWTWSATRAT